MQAETKTIQHKWTLINNLGIYMDIYFLYTYVTHVRKCG